MMALEGVAGAVTAITGFEKGSGKTTFLNHAHAIARRTGPVALFTIGVDGAQKARDSHLVPPEITVAVGDVVMTTEHFARTASARFEILEALPGRSALGPLFVGRTVREGSVTLVGSEHLSVLANLLERVAQEKWAHSVLVDGAVNRLTQIRALGNVNFAFTARIDRSSLGRAAGRIRNLAALAQLPCALENSQQTHRIEGIVNAERLAAVPSGIKALVIEDFTKVFLEPAELTRALGRFEFLVCQPLQLLCFAVTLRDVARDEFLQMVGPIAAAKVLFNPYEVAC
ncbi:MAG: hypothetical protein WAT51_05075 [Holophaga sp.]